MSFSDDTALACDPDFEQFSRNQCNKMVREAVVTAIANERSRISKEIDNEFHNKEVVEVLLTIVNRP